MPLHRTLPFALAVLPMLARAQTDMGVFTTTGRGAATSFVTDYQAIGINPANLAWPGRYPDKHLVFGLAEGSFSIHSDALTKDDLRNRFLRVDQPFTRAEKLEAARKIADAGFTLNADVTLAGVSYRTDALGGIGFQVHDRAQWTSTFSPVAAQLLFLGSSATYFDLVVLASGDTIPNNGQLSEATIAQIVAGLSTDPQKFSRVLDGTRIAMNWYREFNLSYGRKVAHTDAFDLYAGAGLKYLLGIGIVDITAENGSFNAFSSLSPYFDVDYGDAANSTARVTGRDALLPKSVGRGFGVDLGLSAIIHEKVKAGVAVTNLGSITWDGNAYSANDAVLTDLSTNGLDNYDFFGGIDDIVSSSGIIQWQGERQRTVQLPSTLRVGGGYLITPILEAGIDVVVPMNDAPGSYDRPVFALGGDVRPVPWLQLSAGLVAGGNNATMVPAGATFNVAHGTWEFGVASRDIITFFSPTDPTLSLSLGFLRFRF